MSINEIYQCPNCKSKEFKIVGALHFLSEYTLTLVVRCNKCNEEFHFTEQYYSFFIDSEKLKCDKCNCEVFSINGIFFKEYDDYTFWRYEPYLRIECANFDCEQENKRKIFKDIMIHENLTEPTKISFKIMGLKCDKCKRFGEDRYWNKNKRGYEISCAFCGKEEFEKE